MADQKISQLNALTGANTASGDLVTIVDIDDTTMGASGTNKKITLTELQASPVSAGTANGVVYLDGSKVATSGSALTFDGTNLGVGTASPNARLVVQQANNTADGIRLFANGNDSQLITRFLSSIDAWQITASFSSTGAYKPITWWTSDLQRMTLDASGNLGIGTASPGATFGSKVLHVAGTVDANSEVRLTHTTSGTGSADGLTLLLSGDNAYLYNRENGFLAFATNNVEQMRLDASGNLGLGVTPSQWLAGGYMDFPGNGFVGNATSFSSNAMFSGLNASYYSGQWRYKASSLAATTFGQVNGAFQWNIAGSGTAGNAITFTQAMTLDASGNLGIGTISPGSKLDVYGGVSGTVTNIQAGNAATGFVFGVDGSNNCQIRTAQSVAMLFYTNATQRMQISADGNVLVGTAALATTATAGFPWIPSCPGVPTGAPTAPYTNAAAMVVDTTNNRLYVLVGSTWRYATLT